MRTDGDDLVTPDTTLGWHHQYPTEWIQSKGGPLHPRALRVELAKALKVQWLFHLVNRALSRALPTNTSPF